MHIHVGLGALAVIAIAACGRTDAAPEVGRDARVRIVAERLGPGWHGGHVGSVGECVVVMIGDPPNEPVRLYPVEFSEIRELRVSDRYDGAGTPRRGWTPGADTVGERWLNVPVQALRDRYGGCEF